MKKKSEKVNRTKMKKNRSVHQVDALCDGVKKKG